MVGTTTSMEERRILVVSSCNAQVIPHTGVSNGHILESLFPKPKNGDWPSLHIRIRSPWLEEGIHVHRRLGASCSAFGVAAG